MPNGCLGDKTNRTFSVSPEQTRIVVPSLQEVKEEEGTKKANSSNKNFFNSFSCLATIIIVIGVKDFD